MTRGHQIRFVSGIYKGKTGWIDNDQKDTAKMRYVIVDLGSGRTKKTRVNKESVGKPLGTPSCYAEAVLQQCPDIEQKLIKLCLELAKCSIGIDAAGILGIFNKQLHKATNAQLSLGSTATFRQVTYTHPPPPPPPRRTTRQTRSPSPGSL
jgi:hypothetical protein